MREPRSCIVCFDVHPTINKQRKRDSGNCLYQRLKNRLDKIWLNIHFLLLQIMIV